MDFDWKSLVRSVAPILATALGGPFMGLGVKAISTAVLGREDGSEEEIEVALLGADPKMLFELKKADKEFKVTIKKLDISLEDLEGKDRADARQRQIALKDRVPEYLAYMLTIGFFGVLVGLFLYPIPEANKEVIYVMVGSLGTAWIGAMMFFHGSSKSSARKDMLISENRIS